jgi:hypothetical protein
LKAVYGKMKKNAIIVIICLIAGLSVPAASEQEKAVQPSLVLDAQFYSGLMRTPPVLRDDFLKSRLNTVVLGRGLITSIVKTQRFKKNFRIDMIDSGAERLSVRITYHVYIDSKNTISMLKEKEILEFTGQLIGYTPTNSKRDAYILDILLEKGAMLIE